MEISSIIVTIAVLLPGFIAYKISNISVYSPKISTFYTTLYSILFSILICMADYIFNYTNYATIFIYYKKFFY